MKIVVKDPSEIPSENNNIVFALDSEGFVGLLLFKDNEWYRVNNNKKIKNGGFRWIDFIQDE